MERRKGDTAPKDELADIESAEWREARERAAELRQLFADGELTEVTAGELASRWGVSVRTVWRRVRAFREDGGIRAFLPGRTGRPRDVPRIDTAIEEVIRRQARDWWHRSESATIAEIHPGVLAECRARGLKAPCRATVARRLRQLRKDPDNFSGDVALQLRQRRQLVRASYTVREPLAVVQIDHTIADVFVVDPVSRQCIGRPTLTVAIDVATRCVLGICLSLEAPSSLLVALCIEQAVFPKEEWLRCHGLSVDWPMHGLPDAVHTDNGREFHSAGFRRGCDLHGIDTIYRPPATPRFGGHVERLIGTLMRHVRLLPGNSYSDLLKVRPSRAEERAALTLADLGGFMVEDIARYHARSHRALGMSPRQAWAQAWSRRHSAPRVPSQPERFRRDFLPLRRRTVGREGIELFNLKYSCPGLAPEVAPGQSRIVRFDPRDLSRVHLEREGRDPLVVPLRDAHLPTMSLWEWNALRRERWVRTDPPEAEALRAALEPRTAPLRRSSAPSLRQRRRAARAAAWKEVQAIEAMPAPDTTLEATLTSAEFAGALAWEVLE